MNQLFLASRTEASVRAILIIFTKLLKFSPLLTYAGGNLHHCLWLSPLQWCRPYSVSLSLKMENSTLKHLLLLQTEGVSFFQFRICAVIVSVSSATFGEIEKL